MAKLTDTLALAAPEATTLILDLNAAGYALGGWVFARGLAAPGANITLYEGQFAVATAQADSKGTWGTYVKERFADGTHTLNAVVTDIAGNTSPPSAPASFMVNTTPLQTPTAVYVAGHSDNQVAASGTAAPDALVHLAYSYRSDGYRLATQVSAPGGAYSLSSLPLPDGQYSVGIYTTDIAGNGAFAAHGADFTIASLLNRTGSSGNDVLTGTSGNNAFDGGIAGAPRVIDQVRYDGARAEYSVTPWFYNRATVYRVESARDGLDGLYNIERIQFADVVLSLSDDYVAAQAYRLYRAAFDRVPDKEGLGFWILQLDKGAEYLDVAASFIASSEFSTLFGSNSTDLAFVTRLYQHVLHRLPDQEGYNFWVGMLEKGVPREQVLLDFSDSSENKVQLIAEIAQGIEFIQYG